VLRVQSRLAELAVPGQVRVLDGSARTAADAAAALGVEVGQIASSLLFVTVPGGAEPGDQGEPILVLTSGANRVDMAKVASLLRVPAVDRPRADVVKKVTGFAIGGVAPVAHPAAHLPRWPDRRSTWPRKAISSGGAVVRRHDGVDGLLLVVGV
jgi:prolyl-tRNA editing enzyme YbaK/EbsC (Cys-tRNA(Pro) deacylase)